MLADDRVLYDVLAVACATLLLGWVVAAVRRVASRRRPGLRLGRALAAAALVRLLAAGVVAAVPVLRPLRGPDEASFLHSARALASDPSSLGAMPRALVGNLQIAFIGIEQYVLEPVTDYPLRVGHIALAVIAIAIVSVAVTDLAGVRAGALCAWILALEPTNVFFSGVLLKESPMMLAEAVVILGAVRMYQHRDARAVAIMALGLALAVLARPYAGVALAAACAAVSLHAALRPIGPWRRRSPRLLAALGVAVGFAVLVAPAPAAVLRTVQLSQNANATDASNLALSPVDFSSAGSTARNLGSRVTAVLLRPFPWQVANMSQRFGVVGTTVAWALLLALVVLVGTRPIGALVELAPVVYVSIASIVVYALSTGNAGTGFRYRAHLLVVIAAAVSALAVWPRRSAIGAVHS